MSLLTPEEVQELDLADEAQLCAENGIEFLSFPIKDRDIPSADAALKDFLRLLRNRISLGTTVVVHCRAGIGRSAIMAACLLVSNSNPVDQVMSSISRSRGFAVPDTSEQFEWARNFTASFNQKCQ